MQESKDEECVQVVAIALKLATQIPKLQIQTRSVHCVNTLLQGHNAQSPKVAHTRCLDV